MRSAIRLAFFLAAGSAAHAQQSLPEAKLKELKDSTVFVKMDTDRVHSTGSGFLFLKDGDTGYIATNAHVIAAPEGTRRSIAVVFASGTKEESSVAATPVGEDPDRDLAILKVQRAGLPKGLSLAVKAKPRETLPVFILGFPFGEMLATSEGNPAITIGRGSVSSLRNGDDGELAIVQIDGDINPGNSGGPIVDASGALVGVTVAKVTGTGIGFAIPARELDLMLDGRIQNVTFKESFNSGGTVRLDVTVTLIDPLAKLKSVSVLFVPREKAAAPGKFENGSFPRIGPDAQEFPLKLQGTVARGEAVLKGPVGAEVRYLQQPKFVGASGKPVYLQASDLNTSFAAAGAKTPDKPEEKPGDDWLGGGEKPTPDKPDAGAKPAEGGESLAGGRKTVVDAVATVINLPAAELLTCLCWSTDAKAFYAVEKDGTVHRVSWPEAVEQKRLETGGSCSWAALSKEGLVVLVQSIQEAWLLDAATLEPKRKFPVAGGYRFAACPASSYAFFQRGRGSLDVVDLRTGKVAKTWVDREVQAQQGPGIRKHKAGVTLSDFNFPTLTPDGKYLFCVGFECLHRFKVDGAGLVYQEMGPRLGNNPQGIEVSADSKYVCMVSGGGNTNIADHPQVGSYSTYIYRVTDITAPLMAVSSGAYPRTLDFDKASGRIYAQNHDTDLIVFGAKGAREKEYKIGSGEAHQLLAHPNGSKLLVLGDQRLFAVEIGVGDSPTVGGSAGAPAGTAEAAAGTAIQLVDVLKPSARLPLRASVPDLWLDPDGAFLLALNQSDARLLKVRTSDLGVEAEVAVSPECAAMAVSAKGDRIYVVSRREYVEKSDREPTYWSGRLDVFESATLKPAGEFQFEGDPYDVAATNAGLVAISCYSTQYSVVVIDTARRSPGVRVEAGEVGFLHVHPDQSRIYLGPVGSTRGYSCLYLISANAPPSPKDVPRFWSRKGSVDHPLSGEFLLTPDGKTLLGSGGSVVRLASLQEDDLEWVAPSEAWIAAAAAPGCDSVFLATDQGFVKQFSLSKRAVEKSVKPRGICQQLALDGKRKILYAIETSVSIIPGGYQQNPRRSPMAGDLVAWPLEAK